MSATAVKIVVVLAYNGVWTAAVLGGARGLEWPGVAAAAALIAFLVWAERRRRSGWPRAVAFGLVFGLVADGALAASGLLAFPGHDALLLPLPLWMLGLWAAFSGLAPLVLGWLRDRRALAAALGAVAGPFAYWGASGFDAVRITTPTAWFLVALEYALYLPAVLALTPRPASRPSG